MNNRRTHTVRRARGWSLMHMLIAMVLFPVFLLMASKLFMANNALVSQAHHAQSRMTRTDIAVHQLQTDVWRADDIRALAPGLLEINIGGRVIRWHARDQSLIRQSRSGSDKMTIEDLGEVTLAVEPDAVRLEINDRPYHCPRAVVVLTYLRSVSEEAGHE